MAEETATETEITPERAAEMLASGEVTLVDVRRSYEWEAGRLAGAQHIEMNELTSEAAAVPRDRPVIFYCRSGNRSGFAAAAFRQAGWDAYNLAGGLTAWVEEGRPLEPENGEVATPRPGT